MRTKPYFYINDVGDIKSDVDNGSYKDQARKLVKNYFSSESEAREAQKAFYKAMKTSTNIFSRIRLNQLLIKINA